MTERATHDRPRPLWVHMLALTLVAAIALCLILLGNWQMRRLVWKTDLINKIAAGIDAPPIAAPKTKEQTADLEYRLVQISGVYDHDRTQFVKAVTEEGLGYWVMTPLKSAQSTIWINRGFIPQRTKRTGDFAKPEGMRNLTGLLRLTKPGGTWLEPNQPDKMRWFSRDVEAMSKATDLKNAASYFVDLKNDETAAAEKSERQWPRAGMTRVTHKNPHLIYALTWYSLAALLLSLTAYVTVRRMKQ